jgi:hypothetical protein
MSAKLVQFKYFSIDFNIDIESPLEFHYIDTYDKHIIVNKLFIFFPIASKKPNGNKS